MPRLLLVVFCLCLACSGSRQPPPSQPAETPRLVASSPAVRDTPAPPPPSEIRVDTSSEGVTLVLPWEGARVLRDYVPVTGEERASVVPFEADGFRVFDPAPHGVEVHYLVQGPAGHAERLRVRMPDKELPRLSKPRFQIEKRLYLLRVFDGEREIKRFPVALGALPERRKFCQDNASTPEGLYRVYNLQPQATYHKAFDIDYPRAVDHLRHRLAVEAGEISSERSVGGEIQIHGMGIGHNWTHGCIALRNEDMDELFAHPELGLDLEVFITGSQIRPQDRSWLRSPERSLVKRAQETLAGEGFYHGELDGRLGPATSEALGRYQKKHGLPDSCQLDLVTRRHFQGSQVPNS